MRKNNLKLTKYVYLNNSSKALCMYFTAIVFILFVVVLIVMNFILFQKPNEKLSFQKNSNKTQTNNKTLIFNEHLTIKQALLEFTHSSIVNNTTQLEQFNYTSSSSSFSTAISTRINLFEAIERKKYF